jgi:hypothetical protein
MLQRFGLSDPVKGGPLDFLDQLVNPLDDPSVGALPV